MDTKKCTKCGEEKPATAEYFDAHPQCRFGLNSVCRPCRAARQKAYLSRPDAKAAHKARCRKWELKKLYGLTPDQFQEMYEKQNGICAICGGTNPMGDLCVDHNHQTGQVRDLLCRACNLMIGNARESQTLLSKAAAYLQSHSER